MPYSLYLPYHGKRDLQGKTILAADIGGTKTSLGLFGVKDSALTLLEETTVSSKAHATFEEIVVAFLVDKPDIPEVLSIGVAGPVMENRVKLTNLSWELDGSRLERELGIRRAALINDLEATAYGLTGLAAEDVVPAFDTGENMQGNMAILAPGTGLGEAGLFWDGEVHRPFATEGGHSDFAPRTALDVELWGYLKEESDVVCWEHLVSGPGIARIYRFLRDVKGHKEPAWLTDNFKNNNDPAAVISHAAIRELDPTCIKAMDLFVTYMAHEATSLVLKHKAVGGLLLGGGIPPRIYPLLRKKLFRQEFIRNAHMTEMLEEVPIHVILNSNAALIGAAYFGAYGF